MLIEIRTKNFKSFQEELIFSIAPAPKQKGLDYSLLKEKVGTKEYKGLCSAVIYGPNASGKTNIIGAMDVLKNIILRGHIRNDEEKISNTNAASSTLELIPNKAADISTPVDFSIKFIENGLLFEYILSLDLGPFLAEDYHRKVITETLYINEKMIFSRNPLLELGDTKIIREYAINGFEENESSVKHLAKNNLVDDELFLTNGFKGLFSSKLVHLITSWFENKFMVFCRADAIQARPSTSKKNS